MVLLAQRVDTQILGLSPEDALRNPYIASMGIYAFKREVLHEFLTKIYATANDFGSEILPFAVKKNNIQVFEFDHHFSFRCIVFFFFSEFTFMLRGFNSFILILSIDMEMLHMVKKQQQNL